MRVKYGLKERQRHIPIHRLADILDSGKSRALLKAHILTGGDFGDFENDYISQQVEKYHMKFDESNLSAESFDHCLYQFLNFAFP